jgi:chitin disaccharide deacetylase
MPRLVIVNADDLGLSRGVNDGILDAHTGGIVMSASLMVNRAGAEHAAALAREHPLLSVGLHFDDAEAADLDDPDQAAAAFGSQLERFRELVGAEPTHVDSHHHSHAENERLKVFAGLVAPLGVPLRHDGHVPYLGQFYGQPSLERVRPEFLIELIRSGAAEGFTEIGCHPACVRGDFQSSYLDERAVELETLTKPGLREEIAAMGVELASFYDWP